MLDLLLIATLGFLGSFGHCVGMCGPLAVAFSLSQSSEPSQSQWQQLRFHLLLNVGRILSYVLVGLAIGGVGSAIVASGQMAGVGSALRRGIALLTGSLLIWYGLGQIRPGWLPHLPFLHPLGQGKLHEHLNTAMMRLSSQTQAWTPALLGMVWGFIPCGFLYAAQIKAAETGSLMGGALTMLAFGLGTLPTMVGVGASVSRLSRDRRSQLFRLGGWVTLCIGILTLLRTGDTMVDYAGYTALLLLVLALIARPLCRLWPALLHYRRLLGVGAFLLSGVHILHALEHSWSWNLQALEFMLPLQQFGMWLGIAAIACMVPAAVTSFDRAQKILGPSWRRIHLLGIPALLLSGAHSILVGSHFLGTSQLGWGNIALAVLLGGTSLGVLLVRSRWAWLLLSLEKYYVRPSRM
jgi:hypothetical protein